MSDYGSPERPRFRGSPPPPGPTRSRRRVTAIVALTLVAGVAVAGIAFVLWSRAQRDDEQVADAAASDAPSQGAAPADASEPAGSSAGTAAFTPVRDLCDTVDFGPAEALFGPAQRTADIRNLDVYGEWEDGTVEASCDVEHAPTGNQLAAAQTSVSVVVFPSADHVTPFGESPADFYDGTIRAVEDAQGEVRKVRGLGKIAHSYHDPVMSVLGVSALDQNLYIKVAVPQAEDAGVSRKQAVAAARKVLRNAKKELRA